MQVGSPGGDGSVIHANDTPLFVCPAVRSCIAEPRANRRRSGLLQERSRRTRQQLVRTALELWSSRGFESGIEDTIVEEIVERAGVTKGTFYFHFSRKEEILLEMGWDTAEIVRHESERCIKAGRSLDDALARVMGVLARQVKAAPPAAVARSVAEFYRNPEGLSSRPRSTFRDGFEPLFGRARQEGELPRDANPAELSEMLQALVMDSILDWAGGHADLPSSLKGRTELLLAGVRAVPAGILEPS